MLQKLWSNIQANPGQEKFLSVKKNNPALQRRLFSCAGVQEILQRIGYVESGDETLTLMTPENLEIASIMLDVNLSELSDEVKTPAQLELEKRDAEIKLKSAARANEKKRILDQANLDRKEAASKHLPTQSSHAIQRDFGAQRKTYKDIGVDLNAERKGG